MLQTFDQHPTFSETYSTAQEIKDYFKSFQKKHELTEDTKTSHEVFRATWSADNGKWLILVRNRDSGREFQDQCHVLINAGGFLNVAQWPEILGLSDFQGRVVHTAAWPQGLDLAGKHVALVGNGYMFTRFISKMR
jgi:cation diffusion facilitator CzcD-associated flavoprotein CzcO